MQSAKDSFYVMLRDRIASINTARTLVLRGVARPGVVVAENELATTFFAADAFWLRWVMMSMNPVDSLVTMQCEISYATDGMTGNGGTDRGRLLAQMDLELATALRREPQNAGKTAYTSAGATLLSTNVFWTDPQFGKLTVEGERLSRTTMVDVFAYEEAGGL